MTTLAENSAAAPAAGINKPGLGALMLAHTAVDMQTSSLTVLLPPLLAAFSLNYTAAAGIISANNLVIAVAQPLFGLLGDFRRARWLPLAGLALCGAAMASVMFQPTYALVIVAVILSGLGSAAFHPEALAGVRAVSGEQRDTGSSFFFFGGNLGFALGPLAAAFLLERFGRAGALGMALPVALGVAGLVLRRPDFAAPAIAVHSAAHLVPADRPRWKTLAMVGYLLVFVSVRLTITGGLTTFIPLSFSRAGLTQSAIAPFLTTLSVAGTLGTLFSGPLAERLGRRRVIAAAMLAALAGLSVFSHTAGLAQLAGLALAGAALSVPWTLSVIMVQDQLPRHVGLASGLTLGTAYGAMGLGVAALGALADRAGLALVMQIIQWLPALVLLLGLFVPERARTRAAGGA